MNCGIKSAYCFQSYMKEENPSVHIHFFLNYIQLSHSPFLILPLFYFPFKSSLTFNPKILRILYLNASPPTNFLFLVQPFPVNVISTAGVSVPGPKDSIS